MKSEIKTTYLLTNSLATSRKLAILRKNLGVEPVTIKHFFNSLYYHPVFLLENKKLIDSESLKIEELMLNLQTKLTSDNYFKKAMEIQGIRHVVAQGLEEMELCSLNVDQLNKETLPNKEKERSLHELYSLYLSSTNQFTYPKLLVSLLERISSGKYDHILLSAEIEYCGDLELKGIEKQLFESILAKTSHHKFDENEESFENIVKKVIHKTSMKSKITEESLVADVLLWMKSNGQDSSNTSILALDYDKYASIFYQLNQKFQVPVYLSEGIKCKEFSFFEKMLTTILRGKTSQRPLESLLKGMFPKNENDLEDIFILKAGSITRDIIKHFDAIKSDSIPRAYDLLVDRLSTLSLSSKDLGLDENGMLIGRFKDFTHLPIENLVILGLDASHYPIKEHINALLTEEERSVLNSKFNLNFKLSDELQNQNVIERIIGQVKGNLYLGLTSHNKSTGKVKVPSALFNKILTYSGKTATLKEVYKACGISSDLIEDLDSKNPFVELFSSENILSNIKSTQARIFASEVIEEDYGTMKLEKLTISASSLENFVKCPYMHYIKNLCHINPPKSDDDDVTFWLDAMTFGTYVHGVYEFLLKPFLDQEVEYADYLDTLNTSHIEAGMVNVEKDEKLEDFRPEVPKHVKDTQKQFIKELAATFIEKEKKYAEEGYYPVALEEDFKGKGVNLLGVEFKGIIDRIDTDGNGKYRIIDYKTGKNRHKNPDSDMYVDSDGYLHLQHGLYAIAAREIMSDKITSIEAGFYFATDNGKWSRVMRDETVFLEKFEEIINLYRTQAEEGKYYKNPENCKDCDVKALCYNRPKLRASVLNEIPEIKNIKELFYGK
jgi:hypothetical protein